jgi:hypothetical protein
MSAEKLKPTDPKTAKLQRLAKALTKTHLQPEKVAFIPEWVILLDFERKH